MRSQTQNNILKYFAVNVGRTFRRTSLVSFLILSVPRPQLIFPLKVNSREKVYPSNVDAVEVEKVEGLAARPGSRERGAPSLPFSPSSK